VNPQAPEVHTARPLAGAAQAFSQRPQAPGSEERSVQRAPQRVGVGAEQPETHRVEVPSRAHRGMAPAHATTQLPQVRFVLRSASQPLRGSRSQSP
jgi:hypothetical protein